MVLGHLTDVGPLMRRWQARAQIKSLLLIHELYS
jgi:hypothetical protein